MQEAKEIFRKFFEKVVPEMFETTVAAFPVAGMEGTLFTMQVILTGENAVQYGITVEDARKLTVTPGSIDDPMLTVELPASMFIDTIRRVVSSPWRDAYKAAQETRGAVELVPQVKGGAAPFKVKLIMNKAEEPKIKLSADANTLVGLVSGEYSPVTAFMQGRLNIEGDLPFGMELIQKFASFMPGQS